MTGATLIVNADDFGLSAGVNEGVQTAFELGIVTSASLMVRRPAAAQAAAYARACPELSIGLHADLGEWEYRGGTWVALREVAPDDVPREVRDQHARFRELVGREPTHLDSHQHVHRAGPARMALLELGADLGVPVRGESEVEYCGAFYGATAEGMPLPGLVTAESLAGLVRSAAGIVELGCHPAARVDFDSQYAAPRVDELQALCSPSVRGAVEEAEVRLASFAALGPPRMVL